MKPSRGSFLVGVGAMAGAAVPMTGKEIPKAASSAVANGSAWQASRLSFPELVYNLIAAAPVQHAAAKLDYYLREILGAEAQTPSQGSSKITLECVSRADLGDVLRIKCRK